MKFLIVGLGNPGKEHLNTRHNIGFKALDFVSTQTSAFFTSDRLGDISTYKFKGRTLSGKAVSYWMKKEKIPLKNILIVTDDINLPLGQIRIKRKGSDGGHNGLKNIQESLGTMEYARLRIGIGNEFQKGDQINFVLGEWEQKEFDILQKKFCIIQSAIEGFSFIGLDRIMNTFNNK